MPNFIKTNHSNFKDSLIKEAIGLDYLRRYAPHNLIAIPDIHSVNETEMSMTLIKHDHISAHHAGDLAHGLAIMHRHQQSYYGFEENNYIGLNPQLNTPHDHWGRFFIHCRLLYQVNRITDKKIRERFTDCLEQNQSKLNDYLNTNCQAPSLVHGDLWAGNALCDGTKVWLIDPACYFADREVDIAMTEMFGGFPPAFYEAYDSYYPRTEQYETKKVIYNLYHYLNHYNLFGSHYLSGCNEGFNAIQRLGYKL